MGKNAIGRKRQIITDMQGFLLFVLVHATDIQDRDKAVDVLKPIRFRFPWLHHIFTFGGYVGDKVKDALMDLGSWTLQIIKGADAANGFVLLSRQWGVEPTFAWLVRCRHLAKDLEQSIEGAAA